MSITRRSLLAGAAAAVAASPAEADFAGPKISFHNGGKSQGQSWYPSLATDFPFMNKLKMAPGWALADNSGRPSPAYMSANGYPNSSTPKSSGSSLAHGGWKLSVVDDGKTYHPCRGYDYDRVLAWDGNATFTAGGTTVHHGDSLSGTNGRARLTLTSSASPISPTLTITATDGTVDNVRWLAADEEASYNSQKAANPNLEPFSPKFKNTLKDANFGAWRFMDWVRTNTTNVQKWSHRTPIGWFAYGPSWWDPNLYGGTLRGGPSDWTCGVPTGGYSQSDGDTIHCDLLSTASGTTTLQVAGFATKPVKVLYGALPYLTAWAQPVTLPQRVTLTYNAFLDCFLVLNTKFEEGLMAGVPPEVCIDLCNQIGAHPHVVMPCLACDGPSDYMSSYAAYARDHLKAGLKFICEAGPNECWNTNEFGTLLGQALSHARWGVANIDDWYGRSVALVGKQVHDAFSGDLARYAVLCGVHTGEPPDIPPYTTRSTRIEATRHVHQDGGEPAHKYVTHIAVTGYWGSVPGISNSYQGMLTGITNAYSWYNGDAIGKQAAIQAWYGDGANNGVWSFLNAATIDNGQPGGFRRFDNWHAVAQNYAIAGTSKKLGLTQYEGGIYPCDVSVDATHGYDGIASVGDKTVVTINKIRGLKAHAFQVGMKVRFRGALGATWLNVDISHPFTVSAVTDTTVELDFDSSNTSLFPAWTGGGNSGAWGMAFARPGIVYHGTGNVNANGIGLGNGTLILFSNALKYDPACATWTTYIYNKFMSYIGAEFPSQYMLSGRAVEWALFDPDIYAPPSTALTAIARFNQS
jgi:hypothetical protein